MGCKTEEEMKKLKNTIQDMLGENFKVTESPKIKPKIKIINIDVQELKVVDDALIATIKKQNRIVAVNEGFQIRLVKKIVKEKEDANNQRKPRKEESSVIIETDEETHALVLRKGKLNVGWKKVFCI